MWLPREGGQVFSVCHLPLLHMRINSWEFCLQSIRWTSPWGTFPSQCWAIIKTLSFIFTKTNEHTKQKKKVITIFDNFIDALCPLSSWLKKGVEINSIQEVTRNQRFLLEGWGISGLPLLPVDVRIVKLVTRISMGPTIIELSFNGEGGRGEQFVFFFGGGGESTCPT